MKKPEKNNQVKNPEQIAGILAAKKNTTKLKKGFWEAIDSMSEKQIKEKSK